MPERGGQRRERNEAEQHEGRGRREEVVERVGRPDVGIGAGGAGRGQDARDVRGARQVGEAGNDLAAARQLAEADEHGRQDARRRSRAAPARTVPARWNSEPGRCRRARARCRRPRPPIGCRSAFPDWPDPAPGSGGWRRARTKAVAARTGALAAGGRTGIGRTWQNDRNRHRARRWFRRRRNRLGNGRRLWLGRADRRTDDLGLNFGRPRGGIGGRRCRTKRCRFDPCRQLHEIVFEALERTIELLELLAQPADLVQHEDQQDDAAENQQEFHGRPRRSLCQLNGAR